MCFLTGAILDPWGAKQALYRWTVIHWTLASSSTFIQPRPAHRLNIWKSQWKMFLLEYLHERQIGGGSRGNSVKNCWLTFTTNSPILIKNCSFWWVFWAVTWWYPKALIRNRNPIVTARRGVPFADSACVNWNGNWQQPSTLLGSEGPFLRKHHHFLVFILQMS